MNNENALKKLSYCDLCEHDEDSKSAIPCAHCTRNKTYKNFFKETSSVRKLKDALGLEVKDIFEEDK